MTETLKEQLSCFLDGELPEAETTLLLKRLERDEELKSTLSRYSLIGTVLRTDGDVPAARNVAARVREVVSREPLPNGAGARWLRPVAGPEASLDRLRCPGRPRPDHGRHAPLVEGGLLELPGVDLSIGDQMHLHVHEAAGQVFDGGPG